MVKNDKIIYFNNIEFINYFSNGEHITYYELLKRLDTSLRNIPEEYLRVLINFPIKYMETDEIIVHKDKVFYNYDYLYLTLPNSNVMLLILFDHNYKVLSISEESFNVEEDVTDYFNEEELERLDALEKESERILQEGLEEYDNWCKSLTSEEKEKYLKISES